MWDSRQTSYLSQGSKLASVFIFTLRLCIRHLPGLSFHPIAPSQTVFLVKYGCRQGEGLVLDSFEPCVLPENKLGGQELGPSRETTHYSQSMKSSFGVSMLHSTCVYLRVCLPTLKKTNVGSNLISTIPPFSFLTYLQGPRHKLGPVFACSLRGPASDVGLISWWSA